MKKVCLYVTMIIAMVFAAVGMTAMNKAVAVTNPDIGSSICDGPVADELKQAAGCNEFNQETKTVVPVALNIINVVLSLVGVLAVGVIVYGGILYAISIGDSSKIAKAKNCILYGVIGLVVALMAFAIVSFINTSILQK